MLPGWKSEVDMDKCIGCGNCVQICHKKAPSLKKIEVKEKQSYYIIQ